MIEELENLLRKQIELAGRGSLSELEVIAGQCEQLVKKINEAGLLEKPQYKTAKERLAKLYRELGLLLSTQRDSIDEQIAMIRKGKKTLSVYRGSI